MKLISCHIENFGVLSAADYSFDPGLNVILRDNGAGKSTLAAFIRVMLFGFENAKSKNEIDNERRRYEPWQGGIYGGSLRFEAGGREYILDRTFGKTPRSDKFSLRDGETNLESRDYSSRVGQELFDVDSASFLRTVFISQNGCATSATDGINAKLGNTVEKGDDMDSFDHADTALTALLNGLRSSRKVGKLDRLDAEISELEGSVRVGESIDRALVDKRDALNREETRLEEMESRQAGLRENQDRAEAVNRLVELRNKYDGLRTEFESRKKEFDRAKAAFPSSPPQEDELRRTEAAREQLRELETEAAKLSLSDAERTELDRLEKRFEGGIPAPQDFEGQIDLWKELTALQTEADSLRDKLSEAAAKAVKRPSIPLLVAGLVLIIAGLTVAALGHTAGLAACAAGIIAAALAFVPMLRSGTDKEATDQLSRRLKQTEDSASETEAKLRTFTDSHELDWDSIPAALYELKAEAERYRSLDKKRRIAEEKSPASEICRIKADIEAFTEKYCLKSGGDNSLMDIRRRLSDFTHARDEYDKARLELKKFEGREDLEAVLSVSASDRTDTVALIDELRRIGNDRSGLELALTELRRELEELREKRDMIDSDAEKLADKRDKLAAGEERYRILGEARAMLRQAKENMVSRYIGPLTEGFRKYYSLMGGDSPEFYDLDADIVLGVKEAGLRRSVDFLSPGRRDLAGICLRMALIDAMYPGEKPFVVFDDPFVNLDEVRTDGALRFLKKLSARHQIIYFTCHPSRTC